MTASAGVSSALAPVLTEAFGPEVFTRWEPVLRAATEHR